MTIGSQFLTRFLSEAKREVPKGFKFDRSVEAMKKAMRTIGGPEKDFADKIAEVAAMMGIPGMYLNKPDVRTAVLEGAQELRSKTARVVAFLGLHSALAAFYGAVPVSEAKEPSDANNEEELVGNAFQQLAEEILVSLGIPEEMVEKGAKSPVKTSLTRTIAKLRSDAGVKAALIAFARKASIKVNDKIVGSKKGPMERVSEAEEAHDAPAPAPAGVKDIIASAKAIMLALGVDFADETVVRVVNEGALARSIKTACRDPKVKAAMAVFLHKINAGQ